MTQLGTFVLLTNNCYIDQTTEDEMGETYGTNGWDEIFTQKFIVKPERRRQIWRHGSSGKIN
jgi:hypothetical protein